MQERIGFHKARIPVIDLARNDVIGTIVAGVLLSQFFNYNLWMIEILLFILGSVIHAMFGIPTQLNRYLIDILTSLM
jgi:uncharacterized membrane protein YqaE (UPF0057 family)